MRRDLLRKYAARGGADPAQETNKVQTLYSFPVHKGYGSCLPGARGISYMGKSTVRYAIMGMLVVYCLRNVDLMSGSHGIPELIGCLSVVILYVWKRNTLLSIAAGTVLYMFLVQRIF